MARSALLDSHEALVAYLHQRYPELFTERRFNVATWAEWYARTNAYTGDAEAEAEWIEGFLRRLSCRTCQAHAREMLSETPPDLTDADTYFASVAGYHNAVNARLNRPTWSLADAAALWRSVAAG